MVIDDKLLDQLLDQAKHNPRLRQNFDLRTSAEDSSQRMLNALMPGTQVPIHRHLKSTETVMLLRGSVTEVFYDNQGVESSRYILSHETGNYAIQIPVNQWHTVIVTEPCVIFESKDGAYAPNPKEVFESQI